MDLFRKLRLLLDLNSTNGPSDRRILKRLVLMLMPNFRKKYFFLIRKKVL